jgi:hypothetical protein
MPLSWDAVRRDVRLSIHIASRRVIDDDGARFGLGSDPVRHGNPSTYRTTTGSTHRARHTDSHQQRSGPSPSQRTDPAADRPQPGPVAHGPGRC